MCGSRSQTPMEICTTDARPLGGSEPNSSPPLCTPPLSNRPQEYRDRHRNGVSTDVLEWSKQNEPAGFAELMDLRKSLYARRTKGKYRIRLAGLTSVASRKC